MEHDLQQQIPKCKCRKICMCDPTEIHYNQHKNLTQIKEHTQTSSRDSAYNGGISSLPESRSPTPDQKTKKNCFCNVTKGSRKKDKSTNTSNDEIFLEAAKEEPVTIDENRKPKSKPEFGENLRYENILLHIAV